MPLAFPSLNHGQIAFGFFNIESDMLLLEHYFFFATDFCRHIGDAASVDTASGIEQQWAIYDIDDPRAVGDLMGAIHGIQYAGFIGEVYQRFPFPAAPEDFKQKPEGTCTRSVMKHIITKYGRETTVTFAACNTGETATIGEYHFDRAGFQALLNYVWQGGYPRWKDEAPPGYVIEMKARVARGRCALFGGLRFL